ncbi:hypothetical protein BDQ17DRAFT_1440374 [Cyathus striatus]|nr:hypothetical protein BDQ17DRAFT_1440374 [Cyathus striatus]
MSSRLVDGRSCLHLAAQRGLESVVRKLLERSKVNEEEVKKEEGEEKGKGEGEEEKERASSEDDWSSEDVDVDGSGVEEGSGDEDDEDEDGSENFAPPDTDADNDENNGDIPDDSEDEPDILDINLPDWDFGFTPLAYAVLFGTLPIIELLIQAGADVKLATAGAHSASPFHPLTDCYVVTWKGTVS